MKPILSEVLNCRPSIVEMDSKIIVDMIVRRSKPPWTAVPWWQEVIRLCERFHPIINHSYREGNRFADSLANFGVECGRNRIILSEAALPAQALGHIRLERLGFPNIRKISR